MHLTFQSSGGAWQLDRFKRLSSVEVAENISYTINRYSPLDQSIGTVGRAIPSSQSRGLQIIRPPRCRSVNEAAVCTSDPNLETNWNPAGIFHSGKATLTGFVPGTSVWTRFRTVGLKNVMGAWSDPAKIIVV
jgi:hypothetical protein